MKQQIGFLIADAKCRCGAPLISKEEGTHTCIGGCGTTWITFDCDPDYNPHPVGPVN